MYAFEGATLSGQVILKRVKSSIKLDVGSGTAFFNSYGPAVEPMWKAFTQIIDDHIIKLSPAGSIDPNLVEAAKSTFASLDRWLFV